MKEDLKVQNVESEIEDFEFEYEQDDIEFLNDEDDIEFTDEDDVEFSYDENAIKEESEIFKKLREERKRNNNSELHN